MIWVYTAFILAMIGIHVWRRRRKERAHHEVLKQTLAAGLNEPPSLHPVIDASRCVGSGGCIKVCPEEALGMVDGKAMLINGSACIGHGACEVACPLKAITLVFGTEKRGIDIPVVQPNFETNVPGIFIAGELGGMGLIRKAAEQGKQAMGAIVARGRATSQEVDVVIVGAGPAGLAAGLAAIDQKMRYRIFEQESSLGGAIFHYPRQKIAMTAPMKLPLVGHVKMSEISKEALLEFWHGVVLKWQLTIGYGERMERITAVGDGFVVHTNKSEISARSVLLAIGRRGTPRTLEVPGEELSKVTYRLVDPAQYVGQHVLVVGGGDSALEAAIALAGEQGTTVTLSYRGNAFGRVKGKNRDALAAAESAGKLTVRLESQVQQIAERTVTLKLADATVQEMPNDTVIVCAGGVLPTPLLKAMGIAFETKHGTA